MEVTFDGRVVIVTGAGGGLGRTYAMEMARRGAQVVVNDLGGSVDGSGSSSRAADAVVEEIQQAGGEAIASYDSVATPEGGQAIVDTALSAFGTLDVLVSNAGILRDRSLHNLTQDELLDVINVHLLGGFHITQPAFRVMREKAYGRFVFASSNAGIFGNFGQTNYGAAKMGLVGLSNVVAIEGAKHNIKSNVIAPLARTRMTEELLGPMAEMLQPEQVTPMVVYLCSEDCQYTHQIFTAGGGRYARIFIGTNPGWFAGTNYQPSVEEIREHLDQIRDISTFEVPESLNDEILMLAKALAG